MAGCTSGLLYMPCVIESGTERFEPGKAFYISRRMTYRADRVVVISKLLDVTAGARDMSRKPRSRGVVVAFVAYETRKTCVLRLAVAKDRIVLLGGLGDDARIFR